jgi:hypothetical protein
VTSHPLRLTGLAVALALILTTSANPSVTRRTWVEWLHDDAGTPRAAAACVTDRAWDTLPPEVLEAAPRIGFSALPGGWRERISGAYIACAVRTG